MYTCNVCYKEFEKSSQLNGHKQTHIKSKPHVTYLSNPKQCEECKRDIEWRIVRNKSKTRFCSLSCASKNNRRKTKIIHKNDTLETK